MITLTPEAAKQILSAAEQSDAANLALRLAARPVANGGLEYGMGFDEVQDDDMVFRSEGVEVAIRPEHGPLLKGATLHWAEIEGEYHFIFLNPNDPNYVPPREDDGGCGSGGSGGCGCGSGGCAS